MRVRMCLRIFAAVGGTESEREKERDRERESVTVIVMIGEV